MDDAEQLAVHILYSSIWRFFVSTRPLTISPRLDTSKWSIVTWKYVAHRQPPWQKLSTLKWKVFVSAGSKSFHRLSLCCLLLGSLSFAPLLTFLAFNTLYKYKLIHSCCYDASPLRLPWTNSFLCLHLPFVSTKHHKPQMVRDISRDLPGRPRSSTHPSGRLVLCRPQGKKPDTCSTSLFRISLPSKIGMKLWITDWTFGYWGQRIRCNLIASFIHAPELNL